MQDDTLTPHVYRENVFLITGLPVDAGNRDVRRYRDRSHAYGTLTAEVEAVLGVLREPGPRLLHELFALWRTDDGTAPAGVPSELCAAHDRAVEAHRAALDLELDGGDPALRDDAWRRAVALWAPLVGHPGLWDRLRSRVVTIDDPRLTEADVEQLRARLPDLVLDINARLAADGHAPERQRSLMREFASQAGLPADRVDAALERATAGILARVGTACDAAREEVRADGDNALATLSRLDTSVDADLATLRRVLGEQHPAAARTRDHAAETYRICVVRHLNTRGPGGANGAIPYLRTALELAASPATARRIREDLEAVQEMTRPAARATPVAPAPAAAGPVPTVVLPLVFMAIGTAVLLTGVWWWGGPWVAVPGGVLLWFSIGALVTALRDRPVAQGCASLGIGLAMVIIGSLPWGGLWQGDDIGLWGRGHVGMWLVGLGLVYVVSAAPGVGAGFGRQREFASAMANGSSFLMLALWLQGDGGWPAFAATIVLFLVGGIALGGAPREMQAGLLAISAMLICGVVGITIGIGTIGVLPTLLIATAVGAVVVRTMVRTNRANA